MPLAEAVWSVALYPLIFNLALYNPVYACVCYAFMFLQFKAMEELRASVEHTVNLANAFAELAAVAFSK